jgi:hypothetical protein
MWSVKNKKVGASGRTKTRKSLGYYYVEMGTVDQSTQFHREVRQSKRGWAERRAKGNAGQNTNE